MNDVDVSRNTISADVVKWAECIENCVLPKGFVCEGDDMGHNIKGLIGIRLSAANDVSFTNVKISNLLNISPFGTTLCGQYRSSMSLLNTLPGYFGGDVRGISVESSKNVTFTGTISID